MGQAKQKLKGCRPLEQVNIEYSSLCGQLGDYTYRRGMLAKEIEKIQSRLGELDLEAASAKQQESSQDAEKEAEQFMDDVGEKPPTEAPHEVTPESPGL